MMRQLGLTLTRTHPVATFFSAYSANLSKLGHEQHIHKYAGESFSSLAQYVEHKTFI